eukprot:6445374-Pyramimonas_sp.AAC.1
MEQQLDGDLAPGDPSHQEGRQDKQVPSGPMHLFCMTTRLVNSRLGPQTHGPTGIGCWRRRTGMRNERTNEQPLRTAVRACSRPGGGG